MYIFHVGIKLRAFLEEKMSLPNTHHGYDEISAILKNKKKLFFDGIGGVSMNSLAHISCLRGYEVSGYDRTPSEITKKLENMGVRVYYEPNEAHVYDCDALIYTVAMPETNPEYAYAKSHGIPLISRADFLGYIMKDYGERIGISGTHGKSTTTGMIAHILSTAGKNPTVSGGAALKETGEVDMIGGRDSFVFEACEYMDSFLDFNPTVAVVLNIEMDHVDYFKSMEQMRASYTSFMSIPGCRVSVINICDPNCTAAAEKASSETITFGRNTEKADYYSANESANDGYPEFDVYSHGEKLAHITLKLPGEHNIADSLAAFAACSAIGLTPDEIASGISSYNGIRRRMEFICETISGARVFSDYAHHPTEIAATLRGACAITKGKLRVLFQPHTYSRTAELFDGFVSALSSSGASEVILCPIYAARETNVYGISSDSLADAVSAAGTSCVSYPDIDSAAERLLDDCGEGDTVIIMGAGDVIKAVSVFTEKCDKSNK